MTIKNTEPGWFERSSWAYERFRRATDEYFKARASIGSYPWRPDLSAPNGSLERQQAAADDTIRRARKEYRNQILGWYRKLCLPLAPGEETPNEVERLLREEADEH